MSHGPTDEQERPRATQEDSGPSVAAYAGLGFQFLGAILVFLYLGRWLDARLGTAPWLLIVGVFVGAGAGFYSLYRKLMKEQAREDARRAARGAGGPGA
jgi:ATP synthase protein I